MKKIIFSFILAATSAHAAGGHDQGGGGDLCEDRIKIIRDDLKSWIQKGGSLSLNLPAGFNTNQYANEMFKQLDQAQVKCVGPGDSGYPIAISGVAKTCRFDKIQNASFITCDFKKFQAASDSDQYILIHHEYAGLAGIEVPRGVDSSYDISNQIAGYLVDQVVKKLAVRPQVDPVPEQNLTADTLSSLKDKCDHSLPQFFNIWKSLETEVLTKGLAEAQEELKPAKIDISFSSAGLSCRHLGYDSIRFPNAKKMDINIETITGVQLGADVCVATVDPIFKVQNDDLGRALSASCFVPNMESAEDSYFLKNRGNGNNVTVKSPGRNEYGGYGDPIYIFKDIPVRN